MFTPWRQFPRGLALSSKCLRFVLIFFLSIVLLVATAPTQQSDSVSPVKPVVGHFSGLRAAADPAIDQTAATRVFGAQWKQMARRAGIIFAGTVLAGDSPPEKTDGTQPMLATFPRVISAIHLKFRVDRAIAGVDSGQILTIQEWAGAASRTPLSVGQHVLVLFYPPSRLGFTSPVGGAMGTVLLDQAGNKVVESKPLVNFGSQGTLTAVDSNQPADARGIAVNQLERAIRSARASPEQ
jgi:hypothetical protein